MSGFRGDYRGAAWWTAVLVSGGFGERFWWAILGERFQRAAVLVDGGFGGRF